MSGWKLSDEEMAHTAHEALLEFDEDSWRYADAAQKKLAAYILEWLNFNRQPVSRDRLIEELEEELQSQQILPPQAGKE